MGFFDALKSIAEAVEKVIGWKSTKDQQREEALRANEERKRQLKEELAEAEASGDTIRYNHVRSKLRDLEAN